MRKNEIDELINIYEKQGTTKLILKLYEIQKQYKDSELNSLLSAYMHLTNGNNNSCYYTSDSEHIITNNNGSVIYFSRKIFDFKNINNRKIVVKESFSIDRERMAEIFTTLRKQCGTYTTPTHDIEFVNDKVVVSTKHNSAEFNKQEVELIAKLLDYPYFNLSNNTSYLHMQGVNGHAYIKGQKTR